ncbi:MAG: DUF4922 domain-containing protein, partial [Paramuribaculum sp.]|nr:DUF4922 domain-containing protein [Paramuribaculum sp.]
MARLIDIENLYARQFGCWPEVKGNYEALDRCRRKVMTEGRHTLVLQFNPARIRSSSAVVDPAAIAARRCFLCSCNRPKEQIAVDYGDYEVLVNPYPIFRRHLTVAAKRHMPQQICGRVRDMIELAGSLQGMTVFYNAASSGASAPDHFHFQAVPTEELPMWRSMDAGLNWIAEGTARFAGSDADQLAERVEGELWNRFRGHEPEVNLYVRSLGGNGFEFVIIPRKAHRPSVYGEGPGQALISPASVEMAGFFVAPREEDFAYCAEPGHMFNIIQECAGHSMPVGGSERTLDVGIVRASELEIELDGDFGFEGWPESELPRQLRVSVSGDGKLVCNGRLFERLMLTPHDVNAVFTLRNVMIGIGFHWQQYEDQSFHGSLVVYRDGDMIQAVNRVGVETYLRSVVSSEMNAAAPEEFLKAHAVISRSWVLAQVNPPAHLATHDFVDTDSETLRWYDRDAHSGFDICADDHCQRYQGCTKASTPNVESALSATRGEVLVFGNDLCDARFSKCCGGVTERFHTCWQPVDLPYLQAIDDPFCGRAPASVLKTVLNNYDQSTTGYYRWSVEYSAEELADLICRRSGIDYGRILALTPLHRGPSGRIDRLEIKGTKRTRIIGKELEIRRTLSETHLYSSAF